MKNLLEHRCRGEETIVACGRDAADPHERGSGPLSAREAIVIDIFPQHMEHGYWGDLTRTVVKGQPGPKLVALYRAVKEAQRAALKAIKPRVQVCTVHKAAQQVFEKAGFATGITDGFPQGFIHSTGHGVGLDIHEPPSLGDSTARLREGQVITVEPGLYYRTLGGVRIEDTVVVTKEGWRYLVPLEKKFQL
jgi:Xaa-Pro aminopeptidase